MDFDLIEQLALSLSARLWMNLALSYADCDDRAIHRMTGYVLHNQDEHFFTALDWIVACHKHVQLRLPERAKSLEV